MKLLEKEYFEKNIVYLSPHLDDMVLSNGGMVRLINRACIHCKVINIFTQSFWAPLYKGIRTKDNISDIRMKENDVYCRNLQLTSVNLGFDDSSVRGYDEFSELTSKPYNDIIYGKVEQYLLKLLNELKYDYIYCPLALGQHIDHKMVFEIVTDMKLKNVCYYEDLPYASKYSDKEIVEEVNMKLDGYEKRYISIEDSLAEKMQDILIYESQIEEGLLKKVKDYAYRFRTKEAHERIWIKREETWYAKRNACINRANSI